jgi:chromobox protein 1
LKEYWEEIGGKPEPGGAKGKKRGRKSAVAEEATPASAKRAKKEKEWSPPPGSWETEVDYVDTVEESIDTKTGNLTRFAYLVWNNQKKSQHPLHHVYQKCPQKMLQYYESHLYVCLQESRVMC